MPLESHRVKAQHVRGVRLAAAELNPTCKCVRLRMLEVACGGVFSQRDARGRTDAIVRWRARQAAEIHVDEVAQAQLGAARAAHTLWHRPVRP